jgi:hypothetical protein
MLSMGPSGCDATGKQGTWYHLALSKPRGSRVEVPRRSAPEAMAAPHPLEVERPDLAYSTETVTADWEVDMAERAIRTEAGFHSREECEGQEHLEDGGAGI